MRPWSLSGTGGVAAWLPDARNRAWRIAERLFLPIPDEFLGPILGQLAACEG